MDDGVPRTAKQDLEDEAEMLRHEAKRALASARVLVQLAARHKERVEALQTEEVTRHE